MNRSVLRAILRLIWLSWHIATGLVLMVIYRIYNGSGWYDLDRGRAIIMWWIKKSCEILAINVEVKGVISPVKDTLFVSNHISWLDIIALGSVVDTKFVSKSDVAAWPFIGALVKSSGNLFIDRDRKVRLNEVVKTVRKELDRGCSVLFFPEGTTSDGWNVKRFYKGLFDAVANTEHAVQNIALYYKRDGAIDEFAPYIGDDTFIAHLFRICSLPRTKLRIHFAAPFLPISMTRHEIADYSYSTVVGMLNSQRGITPVRLNHAA